MKHMYHVKYTLLIILAVMFLYQLAFAEGTYEIDGMADANPNIMLESKRPTAAANSDLGLDRVTIFKIDILNANEVIDIFTSRAGSNPDVEIWEPGNDPADYPSGTSDWNSDITAGGNGSITTWQNVEDVQDLTTRAAAGLTPVTYTPAAGTGTYTLRLWTDTGDGSCAAGIEFFDIMVRDNNGTVGDESDDTFRRGRIWSTHYAMCACCATTLPMYGLFYVVAGQDYGSYYQAYLWEQDSNGICPYGFHMFVNDNGVGPAQYNSTSRLRSVTPPPEMNPQYPIYLNIPEKTIVTPSTPGDQYYNFFPNCDGAGNIDGGIFEFITDGPWRYEIVFDENKDGVFDFSTEKTLRGTCTTGYNAVSWDGTYNIVADPSEGDTFIVKMRIKAGELHFPFFDVENGLGATGPLIELQTAGSYPKAAYYWWDDTPVGGVYSGEDGNLTEHTWVSAQGNNVLLDTWKWADAKEREEIYIYECIPVIVNGTVYVDENMNEFLDDTEDGTLYTDPLYVKLVPSIKWDDPTVTATSVVLVNADGTFQIPNIIRRFYNIVLDDNNNTTDITPTFPAGWIGTEAPEHIRWDVPIAHVDIHNQNFGLFYGSLVKGTVFLDNGNGGGTANDGIMNGNEQPIPGVNVAATNNAGDVTHHTDQTDQQGIFKLWVPDSEDGNTVKICETNLNAYLSTGASIGDLAGGIYDRTSDCITYTNATGQVYDDIEFGDVTRNLFSPDNTRAGRPGSIIFHKHTFVGGSYGDVSFSITDMTDPTSNDWVSVLYHDVNCDLTIDGGDVTLAPTDVISVATGDQVCLINKVYIPINAPDGAKYYIMTTPVFDYDNANPVLNTTDNTNTDVTIVNINLGDLELIKTVDKATATPGDVLTYTVTYKNIGTSTLSNINLTDPVSDHCQLRLAQYDGGTKDILWEQPDGTIVYLSAAVDADEGKFEYSIIFVDVSAISLAPGEEGRIEYQVEVQ